MFQFAVVVSPGCFSCFADFIVVNVLFWVIDKTGKFWAFNYKTGKIFILKKFLPPDWALSDNVFDWFLWRMGPASFREDL